MASSTIDSEHNEFQLVKKLMLAMICISLVAIFVSYTTGGDTGTQCTPYHQSVGCSFNTVKYDVNTTVNNLVGSLNNATTTPIAPVNSTVLGSGAINIFIAIPNILAHVFGWYNTNTNQMNGFLFNVLLLLADMLYIVIFVIVEFLPAVILSSSFGAFAQIFTIVYGFTVFIIIAYGLYIIVNRIGAIIP